MANRCGLPMLWNSTQLYEGKIYISSNLNGSQGHYAEWKNVCMYIYIYIHTYIDRYTYVCVCIKHSQNGKSIEMKNRLVVARVYRVGRWESWIWLWRIAWWQSSVSCICIFCGGYTDLCRWWYRTTHRLYQYQYSNFDIVQLLRNHWGNWAYTDTVCTVFATSYEPRIISN